MSEAEIRACVARRQAEMSVTDEVGQLIMAGVRADNPAGGADLVTRYRLGGVFLAGRSKLPAAELARQIAELQAASRRTGTGLGLHVGADQEGGKVRTLQGAGIVQQPSAVEQGAWSASRLRASATATAKSLAAAGVTVNLAPVADVVPAGTAADNPPIGYWGRQYGSTPAAVSADLKVIIPAFQGAGVVTTVKHFPGLGRVRANTDTSTEAVDPATTADDPALAPFAAAIAAGTGWVMVSLARYPALDPTQIAAFSPAVVDGLLRARMGFTGVVVSDDLGIATAVASVPAGSRAVAFVAAGGDVVLTVDPASVPAMRDALAARASASTVFHEQVRASVARVLTNKIRVGLIPCAPL